MMNRREYLIATASAAAMIPAMSASAASQFVATPSVTQVDGNKYQQAWEVQRSTLVVDGLDGAALTEKYLQMLQAGGVNCWHQSVGGFSSFANLLTFLDQHSQAIVQAGTVREIRQAHEQGRIAHVAGWQSALSLISDANGDAPLGNLRAYKALGLRIASIAYNNSNVFGGGCLDPDVPLTRRGYEYVEEIHKQRLLLDVCGHTNERTSLDAIQASKGVPIICSHTNLRALKDNPRNISNRLIEEIAKTGGVVGLTSFSDFHTRSRADADVPHSPQASLDLHLDQYDYLKQLVGVDHIGMGPDFMTGRTDLDSIGMRRDLWPEDAYSELPFHMVKDFET
ncbi:MAG TPA: membrane dipeptidase, partial [Xanthomonadales bacterium]|nr:membrane dipeptidase [Xanthomonadales bacterium]